MTKKSKSENTIPQRAFVFPDLRVPDGEELHFDFEPLAKTLAELARNPDNATPFTVVVKGDWGRGKTTLLRRAKYLMEHPSAADEVGARQVKTLWFNAWKYPNEEMVLAGLLGALLDRLDQGNLWEQLSIQIDERKHGFAKTILRTAAPWLFDKGGPLAEDADRYAAAKSKRAYYDAFQPLFGQASRLLFKPTDALRDSEGRGVARLWDEDTQRKHVLAVFLDDLDRCHHARVVEVLEAINLFLDQPGVCFFLGLSWDRLHTMLPDAVRGHEDAFMEKIVQVALELPAITRDSARDYLHHLRDASPLKGWLTDDDGHAIATLLEDQRHPRHLKRFLNDLSMGLSVLRNGGKLADANGGEEGTVEADPVEADPVEADDVSTEPQVPPRAVIAWHLLAEVLSDDEWRALRGFAGNLDGFFRRWDKAGEPPVAMESDEGAEDAAAEAGKAAREADAVLVKLRALVVLDPYVEAIEALNKDQRRVLVHLASPPAIEMPRAHSRDRMDLFDLDGLAWVPLAGGEFTMGSNEGDDREKPEHRRVVSPFRIGRFPVTNAQYAVYVKDTGKQPPEHWDQGAVPEGKAQHPVTHVSWEDATAFSVWLSQRIGTTGSAGEAALPREAEWEFAARGAEGRLYPWGLEGPTDQQANFGMAVSDTSAVDAYPNGATPDGVHDLAGNVLEWCHDWYGPYVELAEKDSAGPTEGSSRVLRGGSFGHGSRYLRGACRFNFVPRSRNGLVGFRVVWRVSGGLN